MAEPGKLTVMSAPASEKTYRWSRSRLADIVSVAKFELAPDGRPSERGIGLGVAAQAPGSSHLDDGASFVEEAVRRGQG